MKNNPLVSIIIVNYNGKKFLEKCLNSLMKIDYKPYEIILVDNSSSDGSVEFVETNYPKISIVKLEKNYGYAKANNIGVQKATGEFIQFLNNDTEVKPDFALAFGPGVSIVMHGCARKPHRHPRLTGRFLGHRDPHLAVVVALIRLGNPIQHVHCGNGVECAIIDISMVEGKDLAGPRHQAGYIG